ncbi:MAG: DUF177 domain-containing protein [Acidobacteria bacterium]|nr:DUF177 domain-containing protein [Acidobacteriota bacterium]MBU4253323.1 DUF177 domain-containing protein [Acidobacteriota bacterium]
MIIDIDLMPDEGVQVCQEFDFFSMELVDENAVFLKPVSTELYVKKSGEDVFIKGHVSALLSFVCHRCLTPYEFPVDSDFDLVYFPEELDEIKDQLESGDLNSYFYQQRQIDLNELVLEQLNLTFPYKSLCRQDCQGICPVCGIIVREGLCSCEKDETDPRLVKLKTYMKDKR